MSAFELSDRDTAKRIRANPAFRRTRIIGTTSVEDQGSDLSELDGRIVKPVQPSVLMERISEVRCDVSGPEIHEQDRPQPPS